MQSINVKMSPKQISRIRNGHKVRVKAPEMEGEGVSLIVKPETYDIVTRTFSRKKGLDISLDPEEIMVNKQNTDQMEGKGIFGKKFDRAVKKTIGKPATKALYGAAKSVLLPLARQAIQEGGVALQEYAPELTPLIGPGSKITTDYLTNPSKYQGKGLGTGLGTGNKKYYMGINGGMLAHLPPALQSQPYASNFQFQHTLPPSYQKFSKGSGLYI